MILGIYGAGGLRRELYGFAKSINRVYKYWVEIVFINDAPDVAMENIIN